MSESRTDVFYVVQLCREVAFLKCCDATIINCFPIAVFDNCISLIRELARIVNELQLNVRRNAISIDTVCNDAFAMRIDENTFIDIRRIYRNCIKAELLR